jgi:hypothetical protein
MFTKKVHGWGRLATTALLSFGFITATTPTSAQDTALKPYEVELVVFRTANPMGSPEDWALEETRAKQSLPAVREGDEPGDTATTTATSPPPTAAFVTSVGSESSIQPLESARYKLTPIEATLKRSRSYQPLAHIGWWQPAFPRETPRPVGIENLVGTGTGITGTVTLTRGTRLLHLDVNLTYQAPDGQRYVLREQRALRSGDKHYFDHPYFGVIALVTPKG